MIQIYYYLIQIMIELLKTMANRVNYLYAENNEIIA